MSLKEKANQLMTDIPAVYLALKKQVTPLPARLLAGITVIYALSPIDLIPDFIPFFGYLDDIFVLPAMISLTIKLIPEDIMQECRSQAKDMWNDGKPVKWYHAIPVIIVWLLIIRVIVKAVWL